MEKEKILTLITRINLFLYRIGIEKAVFNLVGNKKRITEIRIIIPFEEEEEKYNPETFISSN